MVKNKNTSFDVSFDRGQHRHSHRQNKSPAFAKHNLSAKYLKMPNIGWYIDLGDIYRSTTILKRHCDPKRCTVLYKTFWTSLLVQYLALLIAWKVTFPWQLLADVVIGSWRSGQMLICKVLCCTVCWVNMSLMIFWPINELFWPGAWWMGKWSHRGSHGNKTLSKWIRSHFCSPRYSFIKFKK